MLKSHTNWENHYKVAIEETIVDGCDDADGIGIMTAITFNIFTNSLFY